MTDRARTRARVFMPDDRVIRVMSRAALALFVAGLAGMAGLAIWAFVSTVSGQGPDERVVLSVITVVVFSGAILVTLHQVARSVAARWLGWTFVSICFGAQLLLVAAISTQVVPASKVLLTTLILIGGVLVASPYAVLFDQRRGKRVCCFGFTVASLTAAVSVAAVWLDLRPVPGWSAHGSALLVSMWSIAGATLYTGLMRLLKAPAMPGPLLLAPVALVWFIAAGISVTQFDPTLVPEAFERWLAASAVLAITLTIACTALHVSASGKKKPAGPGALLIPELQLVCPVCSTTQRVAVGDDRCSLCKCRFEIRVTPQNCPGCGYALADLPERKCPECGHAF